MSSSVSVCDMTRTSSTENEAAKRFKTASASEREPFEHGQGCSSRCCRCDSEDDENLSSDSSEPERKSQWSGKESVRDHFLAARHNKPEKTNSANTELESSKLENQTSSSAFIQFEELDFNLKSDLIMQPNKKDTNVSQQSKLPMTKAVNRCETSPETTRNSDQSACKTDGTIVKFDWEAYLSKTNSKAAPPECFYNVSEY